MITLQYNSLVQLIDEFIGQFSKMNDNNPLDRDAAINWGIDCLREIGMCTAEQKEPTVLSVIDNKAVLPNDVLIINGVYPNDSAYSINGYQRLYSLQYVGGIRSNSVSVDKTCLQIASPYTFSINYPYLVFNFSDDREVWLDYKGFKVDSDGIPMYPAIPSVREAINSYILYRWQYEEYLLDNIKSEKFGFLKQEKSDMINNARQDCLSEGMMEVRNRIYQTRNRYSAYRIPK